MLSYQHIYHAGNMADVHKHLWLLCVLDYLNRKDKPYCWIDTHSGRGAYDLDAPEAQKLGEYKDGVAAVIGRVRASAQPLLALYGAKIMAMNGGGVDIHAYPGSAMLAAQMLRGQDRLLAYDLHPQEFAHLAANLKPYKNARTMKEDGYQGMKSILPPALRRGGVLIDPSYEVKSEYDEVARALTGAMKRWPQGIYMVWYPILVAGRHEAMCAALEGLASEAGVEFTRDEWMFGPREKGLLGSGMFILNTPYSCAEAMAAARCDILAG